MDTQITLRLPKDLARRLERQAKARAVKKSQLVREAVTEYLARAEGPSAEELWERTKHLIGSVTGKPIEPGTDWLAEQIYRNNFRD